MTYTRKNVFDRSGDWPDPVLWYARGVAAMKTRALANPTSWRFYGAIHGIYPPLWEQFGYLTPADPMPSAADSDRYWNQCQHGSWYFLPWHRGYLLAFEAIIRAEVIRLRGPEDWALPYWNYFQPGQESLPPAFASPDWPDGLGDNPLFVPQRYGPNNDGNVFVPSSAVNLDALTDPDFTGVTSGGGPGFGGVDTGFEHGGGTHGALENQPHDWVHGLVGGSDPANPRLPGLMSDPDTAALDPIFWLHHANIDRLWEVWRKNPPTHLDPVEPRWLNGPATVGQRIFSLPKPDGSPWDYTPRGMVDLGLLGYAYDDLSPAIAPAPLSRRLRTLGAGPETLSALEGVSPVPPGDNVELVGANQGRLRIIGTDVRTAVQLDQDVRGKVSESLRSAAESVSPDRVFLNLENVRGLVDSTAFHVYVGLSEGANPADHPANLAGSVALFGLRKATTADPTHSGAGLTYVLEITKIIDALHLNSALDVDSLDVRIVPVKPVPDEALITIGRVSIFRQGL